MLRPPSALRALAAVLIVAGATSVGSVAMPTSAPASPAGREADGVAARADQLWYGPGGSPDHAWYGKANRGFAGRAVTVGGTYVPLIGDFGGDGRDDVLWYGPGGAADYLWQGTAGCGFVGRSVSVAGVYVPLVGDFHFNGHKLLTNHAACAQALAKYRINPGNVGKGSKHDAQFAVMIERAIEFDKPVRIGVNWGSLDQDLLSGLMDENARSAAPVDALHVTREALIQSALRSAELAESIGLPGDRIVLA